ncbi:MAG: galactose oxidase-like domain-containing protein [Candidatus Eiseniibacteriota bacterium]
MNSSPYLRSRAWRSGVALLLLLVPELAAAQLNLTGRWTPKLGQGETWSAPAIHMILTRGVAHHSQILWYDSHAGHPPTFKGGLWGWNPNGTTAEKDCTAYPASRFTPFTLPHPTGDIFCTGHSALADGRVLISGGTEAGETGITQSIRFDPSTSPPTWQLQGSMAERRWYPTSTTLPDGRVLISSGTKYLHMYHFGGRSAPETGTLKSNDIQLLALTQAGQWDPAANNNGVPGIWPEPRDAHSASWNKNYSEWTIFGGRNQDGTLRRDTWFMYRNLDKDDREDYSATPVATVDPRPRPRYRHATVVPAALPGEPDTTVVLIGGFTDEGIKNDVWQLKRDFPSFTHSWNELSSIPGPGPSPRQGHAAVWDPENDRILVFGGANASDVPIDNTVYALSLYPSPVWSQPAVDGAGGPLNLPNLRHGHAFLLDPFERTVSAHGAPSANHNRRAILWGGKDTSQFPTDIWTLWIPKAGSGANYKWQRVTPPGALPQGRYRFGSGIDIANDRLIISGGDLGGTASSQTWSISLDKLALTPEAWSSTLPSYPTGAVTGHAMLLGSVIWARKQERFDPGTGFWTDLGSIKRQDWYPFHFVAPRTDSLMVFMAGPDEASAYLNLSKTPPQWRPFPYNPTPGFRGGSAVMYRPGEVMKCGSRDTDPQGSRAVKTTMRIDLTTVPPPSSWSVTDPVDTMIARVNHNLTILPDGKVFVNGGTTFVGNAANAGPVFTPQMWNPATGKWSASAGTNALAADNTIRGYHSNAVLLPDGRVLTAGGFSVSADQAGIDSKIATIFCPPYLFNPNGTLRTRPSAEFIPGGLRYGQQFSICGPSVGISKVALIRPASSTHAFNQDQRYVPLTFQYSCDNQALQVIGPTSSNVVPPGDYLLFLVKSDDTPSVASWIRIGPDQPDPDPCLCGPGGGTMLAGGSSSGWTEENELLGQGQDSQPIKLRSSLDASDGSYRVRLAQGEGSTTSLDAIHLLAVDHAADTRSFSAGRSFLLGSTVPARSIATRSGGFSADVSRMEDGTFTAEAGDTLEIELTSDPVTPVPLYLEARRGSRDLPDGESDLRVVVQALRSGSWQNAGRFDPHLEFADVVIDSCSNRVRMVFGARTQLRSVGHVAIGPGDGRVLPETLDLLTANHSRLGSVTSEVTRESGGATQLAERDTLVLRWSAPVVPPGKVRSLFVVSRSVTTSTPQVNASLARAEGIADSPSSTFRLESPRPNPSLGTAKIAYALPAAMHIRIRVYDVAGRLVRTLMDRESPAGPGEVVWDGRDDDGRRLSAGVFFYRMEAGEWQSRKKMILASAE